MKITLDVYNHSSFFKQHVINFKNVTSLTHGNFCRPTIISLVFADDELDIVSMRLQQIRDFDQASKEKED